MSTADADFLNLHLAALYSSTGQNLDSTASAKRTGETNEMFRLIQEDQESVEFVKRSLERSEQLKDQMVTILSSFEERLQDLETVMLPIHKLTQSLTKAHDNIELTTGRVGAVLEMLNVAVVCEKRVYNPRGDIEEYCGNVDRIAEAIAFFNTHRQFKVSDKALSTLKSLLARALENMTEQVVYWLSKYDGPIEPTKLPEELPPILYTIPDKEMGWLQKLCGRLHEHGSFGFLKAYKESRAKFLLQSILKISPRDIVREDEKMGTSAYTKGSHKAIRFTLVFVKLLLTEKELAKQLLAPSVAQSTFTGVVEESVELYCECVRSVVRRRRSPSERMTNIFSIYDILEVLRAQWPVISATVGTESPSKVYDMVSSLRDNVVDACKKSFNDVLEDIKNHSVKLLPNDGTIHELTTTTLSYLRVLVEYEGIVKDLLPDKDPGIPSYIVRVFGVLRSNLEAKARGYKDPTVSILFLLNNTHYMLKSIRRSSLNSVIPADIISEYGKQLKRERDDVSRSAWSAVLENVLDKNRGLSERVHALSRTKPTLSKSDREAIKAKFAGFNAAFEELRKKQSRYVIPDAELCGIVETDAYELLVPLYKNMMEIYGSADFTKFREKYIKHTVVDFGKLLRSFFSRER